MKRFMAAAALALVAVLTIGAVTATAGETIKRVLPENGLTVILQENHSAPVVNLRMYVKAGSILEGEYLGCGISHYCEHLLSDGTPTRTLEQIEAELSELGGGSNAYTTKDHTCYFIETSREHFDEALDILSDWGMNASFPEEAVEAQRGVITREINMGYDEPGRRVYNLFGEAMFRCHPARYPVIGYLENFERVTREDLLEYKSRMYVPNNMVFVAVGDFDADVAYERIHEAFRDFERKPIDTPALMCEPEQLGRRVRRDERDLDMAYVMMGYHTVPLSHPDLYPLDIMSHVLSEGNSSRLHKRLVEELGLVHSVTTWSHTPGYDAGVFAVSMVMDPANVDRAIEVATEELYALRDRKVSKDEIEKAKKLKTAEFYLGRQDMESIASSLGTSEISSGNPDFDAIYVTEIQNVTADQIREVARKYFSDDNLGVAILAPPSGETAPEADVATQRVAEVDTEAPVTERRVLENGLTVLVRENHTNPLVSVGSFSLAGTRFEDPDRPGVANFVANMMPRGTGRRSGERISTTIDGLGAEYSCGANHTRIETDLTLLSEDLEDGFELFADILTNPKFDETEMEKARREIHGAITARADNWTYDAMDIMLTELFPSHPYGRPPVGDHDAVDAITRDDLEAHHSGLVTPNNTVVTVFGDVTVDEAVALVEKELGDWEPGRPASAEIALEPRRTEPTKLESYHDRAQTVIFMGYHGMPYSSEDRHAMDVLDAVTSGINYPGGWLHTDLRGNSLVYVVHAYNFTGYDTGYFGIYAATFDEALDQAMGIIEGHMERIATEPVSEEELELAKQLCIIMDQTNLQTNGAQAHDAAVPELYGLGHDYESEYAQRIQSVTADDVLRVAKKYLSNPVTVIRRPRPSEEHAEAAE
jgi:zinc protease